MSIDSDTVLKQCVSFQMTHSHPKLRGGKAPGSGRKPEGKARYTVTLKEDSVLAAKAKEPNFSGLLDRLLDEWLITRAALHEYARRADPTSRHEFKRRYQRTRWQMRHDTLGRRPKRCGVGSGENPCS